MTMTTTADTPLQRAAKVIKDADKLWLASDSTTPEHYDEFVACAALIAALQVKWEPELGCDGSEGARAFLGSLEMAVVYPHSGKFLVSRSPFDFDPADTLADAKSAVQRAVIEAILGVSL